MARQVNLPGALVVVAALAGGTLLGIVGALLAAGCASYLVYVLEIVKWRNTPLVTIVRDGRAARAERKRPGASGATPTGTAGVDRDDPPEASGS